MKLSEVAELLAAAGTFLAGAAAVINAIKKKPSEPKRKPQAKRFR